VVRAGQLRHVVEVQESTDSRNAHGGITPSWTTIKRRRFQFVDSRGREFQLAKATNADMTHLLKGRYWQGLTTENRFLFNGRVLEIDSVVNTNERDVEYLVQCREVV
jgi:SPP1 family predicted phage head-tail adaptor